MTNPENNERAGGAALRLWPGAVLAVLICLAWLVPALFMPDAMVFGLLGAAACTVIIVIWWLFFSRAPWSERLGALVVMAVAVVATKLIVHPSIANAGMGRMLYVLAPQSACVAFVAALVATRHGSIGRRRGSMLLAILLGCAAFALLRTGGISGGGKSDFHLRWTKTPEERLLEAADEPAVTPSARPAEPVARPPAATVNATPAPPSRTEPAVPAAPAVAAAIDKPAAPESPSVWPGFRGPNRDSIVHGVQIETDWAKSPPAELWRRPIGPGWSSFAVRGNSIYTQEQRGSDEIVSAYDLRTGKPVWRHRDTARFYESNGGPGPRATPAVHNGRVYTHGATGMVNALDADTGAVVWSRNSVADTGATMPGWGFAGSPLVVDDTIVIAASGRLAAYDPATGKRRWTQKTVGGGYSSPQLATIDGVTQIVMLSGGGATGVAPRDGTVLWQHKWEPGVSIVQPALIDNRDVLLSSGDAMGGLGLQRIGLSHATGAWQVEPRWTTRGLKPYFNDYVVHKDHAYGFDGSILSCIDLNDGTRKWKGGRYGNGQFLLLADQDLLLVLSEDGELALVKATPDQFTEVARVPAIEGKTWNHPALAGDVLLVRNGEEMAAFRLTNQAQ